MNNVNIFESREFSILKFCETNCEKIIGCGGSRTVYVNKHNKKTVFKIGCTAQNKNEVFLSGKSFLFNPVLAHHPRLEWTKFKKLNCNGKLLRKKARANYGIRFEDLCFYFDQFKEYEKMNQRDYKDYYDGYAEDLIQETIEKTKNPKGKFFLTEILRVV